MGEVYRAHDSELGREVALKVLSPAVSGNPDSLSRFEREARLLASLNHPNIAAIYGVTRQDSTRALPVDKRTDNLGLRVRAVRDAHRPPRIWRLDRHRDHDRGARTGT
jgi:hypothetical protein